MTAPGGGSKEMPSARLKASEAEIVIPYDIETMRAQRAMNDEVRRFAALEFGPASRGWARAASVGARRSARRTSRGRLRAFVAYLLLR